MRVVLDGAPAHWSVVCPSADRLVVRYAREEVGDLTLTLSFEAVSGDGEAPPSRDVELRVQADAAEIRRPEVVAQAIDELFAAVRVVAAPPPPGD